MPLTDSLVAVADVIYDKLTANMESLGLAGVLYGDQELLPSSPIACVESDNKTRDLRGATRRTDNVMTVFVLLYHSEVRSPQSNRRDSDLLAERVEALLHLDPTLGGIVTHSYATQLTSGYVVKNGQLLRASRITFQATSVTSLPPSP